VGLTGFRAGFTGFEAGLMGAGFAAGLMGAGFRAGLIGAGFTNGFCTGFTGATLVVGIPQGEIAVNAHPWLNTQLTSDESLL
jgi:hypothetical protein